MDNAGGTTVTSLVPTEANTGDEPSASGTNSIAIAVDGSTRVTDAQGNNTVLIGNNMRNEDTNSVRVGGNPQFDEIVARDRVAMVGDGCERGGNDSVAVGAGANASDNRVVCLGADSTTFLPDTVAIGYGAEIGTSNVARIGGTTEQLSFPVIDGGKLADADINNNEMTFELDETNSDIILKVKDSAGTLKSATISIS